MSTRRVLFVHRYFWPDVPPYATMLRFISERIARDGYGVTVFCGPVTYNDVRPANTPDSPPPGVQVRRVRLPSDDKQRPVLRAISMLTFAVRLVAHAVRRRSDYDLMTVTTIPPVVMGVAARIIRRLTGIPYIYHCMDLYPEIVELTGSARNRALLSMPRRLDAANCRRAAAVIVLSQDMRATLVARGLDASNILVLNNFDTIEASDDHDQGLDASDDSRFRLIFAGNMGRVQGLDNLVAAAAQAIIQRPQIEMTFMGSGALVGALKRQAGNGSQIRFLEHRPAADAARVLHGADIGVVSLAPAVYRLAYPSKTSAYLAAGCRLLVVVEANSELAQLVEAETLGSVCPPGDVTALTTAIVAAADRGRADIAERERLAAAGAKYFGRDARLDDWSRLIATLAR